MSKIKVQDRKVSSKKLQELTNVLKNLHQFWESDDVVQMLTSQFDFLKKDMAKAHAQVMETMSKQKDHIDIILAKFREEVASALTLDQLQKLNFLTDPEAFNEGYAKRDREAIMAWGKGMSKVWEGYIKAIGMSEDKSD